MGVIIDVTCPLCSREYALTLGPQYWEIAVEPCPRCMQNLPEAIMYTDSVVNCMMYVLHVGIAMWCLFDVVRYYYHG